MINRQSVLQRHNPHYKTLNKSAPLSVGNGTFCFTADFTGLQTFFDDYCMAQDAFPLCTMSEWGWHSYQHEDESLLRLTPYDTYGRTVYYATDDKGQEELFKRVRVNAHKFHLGLIGFELQDKKFSVDNCVPVSQLLSLWEGVLFSEFKIDGNTVKTETFIHPKEDTLYVRAESPLLKAKELRITINFPYGSHKKTGADFSTPHLHETKICKKDESVFIERKLNDTIYKVTVNGTGFTVSFNEKLHTLQLIPHEECIDFSVRFEPVNIPSFSTAGITLDKLQNQNIDSFDEAKTKVISFWKHYWSSGGFIDFTGSTDSRAVELERRIILSQYLTAIQSRGKLPPAETGLTCNSWYGKFHLEMHFWHHAHYALWNRKEELLKSLEYYKKILPIAKEIASSQGYSGARWAKMCDPSGRNTPSSVAVLLIWQQPNPIMLAELYWRAEKNTDFLREYRDIVIETAEFMKSFVHWETDKNSYVLGPPYIPAQERHDPNTVLNAAFELEYFRWGFRTADKWLNRLGEQARYGEIAEKLSLPPKKYGVYLAHENCPDTFNKLPFYTDHPSMLAMYGVLDSDKIDINIMSATLDKVFSVWDKKTFYGWDFPMMAMNACRLGRYKDAIDLLLMEGPKNTWLENGHNKMTGDDALPLYLPGNGGLLLAAAMIAAGYGEKRGSSFPEGLTVNIEGILPYI
jgi:trehalose/maltose hydrolase-like predicted phosphorylase